MHHTQDLMRLSRVNDLIWMNFPNALLSLIKNSLHIMACWWPSWEGEWIRCIQIWDYLVFIEKQQQQQHKYYDTYQCFHSRYLSLYCSRCLFTGIEGGGGLVYCSVNRDRVSQSHADNELFFWTSICSHDAGSTAGLKSALLTTNANCVLLFEK